MPAASPGEVVGVVPAAGYATRLQPLEGSKELVPIGGRPVMDHLVERMRIGGCTRLRVVTRLEKDDVVAHATEALGAEVVLAQPPSVSESLVAGMEGLAAEDIVLIGFPDSLWEPLDGYRTLVHAVLEGNDAALGLFRIPSADLSRSDVVAVDDSGRVLNIQVKPARPQSDVIWGCAAARVDALTGMDCSEFPGGHFDRLCREGRAVLGIPLSDVWIDVGTKGSLEAATTMFPSAAEVR